MPSSPDTGVDTGLDTGVDTGVDALTRPEALEEVRTRRLSALLLGVTATILGVHTLLQLLAPRDGGWREVLNLFNVTYEANVPTFWNSSLLVLLSAACATVWWLLRGSRRGWLVAAVLTFLLGADEILRGHEQLRLLGDVVARALPIPVPTYTWLLPGVLLAGAGALLVWTWTRRLPRRTRWGLRLALVAYGLGAVVAEGVSGLVQRELGLGIAYGAVTLVEEGLEMTACVIAIVAVLKMLRVGRSGPHRVLVVPTPVPA